MDHVEDLHWLVLIQIHLNRFQIHYKLWCTLALLLHFGNLHAMDALGLGNLRKVVVLVADHRFNLCVGMVRLLNTLVGVHESQIHFLLQLELRVSGGGSEFCQ